MTSIIYLHGFTSGPNGDKVTDLAARLDVLGITLRRPDLNVPDFEHMTITSMIARVAEEVAACPPEPVYLMGSSLGGFTALQFLKLHAEGLARRVAKLVLIAPALDFPRRLRLLAERDGGPDALARWQAVGTHDLYHYAYDRAMPLGYGFVEDVAGYSDGYDVPLHIPTLIFHGRLDDSVPCELSERFATGRDTVTLHVFEEGDHGLVAFVPAMWDLLRPFWGV